MLWRTSRRVHVFGRWSYIYKIQQSHSNNTTTLCLECFVRRMCFDTNKENDRLLSREQDLGHNAKIQESRMLLTVSEQAFNSASTALAIESQDIAVSR